MNRRTLLRSFLGAAVASCVRWLPMPAVPEPEELLSDHLDLADFYDIEPLDFGGPAADYGDDSVPVLLWVGDYYEACGIDCGMHNFGGQCDSPILTCAKCGSGRMRRDGPVRFKMPR